MSLCSSAMRASTVGFKKGWDSTVKLKLAVGSGRSQNKGEPSVLGVVTAISSPSRVAVSMTDVQLLAASGPGTSGASPCGIKRKVIQLPTRTDGSAKRSAGSLKR